MEGACSRASVGSRVPRVGCAPLMDASCFCQYPEPCLACVRGFIRKMDMLPHCSNMCAGAQRGRSRTHEG